MARRIGMGGGEPDMERHQPRLEAETDQSAEEDDGGGERGGSQGSAGREKKEYRLSKAAEARKLKYEPDKKCQDEAGFSQDDRSLTGRICERMGMLPPLPSRWNKDGTWNW